MIRKIKCKVCNYRFVPKAENKKVIVESLSIHNALSGRKYYEAFDCPMCDCQNIVNIREGGVPDEYGNGTENND